MSTDSSYCFIINCASNASRAKSIFKSREKELRGKLFGKVEFIYVGKEDSIIELANKKAEHFTHIVACGGDGTVNRVANGIMGTDTALGVLPLGSGNDFAQNIGLKLDFDKDLEILLNNKITRIDAVQSSWGYFLNTYGIGVDGLTNYYSSKSTLKSGEARYFTAGLRALFESKPFDTEIRIKGSNEVINHKAWMVTVANGKSEGGKYQISPGSDNSDGILELVVVKKVSRMRLITEFLKLSLGFSFKKEVLEILKSTSGFEVSCPRNLRAHADGEQIGSGNDNFEFSLAKSAISVVTDFD